MAKSKRKKPAGCKRATITFKTKRGRTVSFPGRTGTDCGPRKKPSTRHLREYKVAMGLAARECKGRKGGAFRNCVAGNIKSLTH
jgi:hypothetical protein